MAELPEPPDDEDEDEEAQSGVWSILCQLSVSHSSIGTRDMPVSAAAPSLFSQQLSCISCYLLASVPTFLPFSLNYLHGTADLRYSWS